MHGAKTLIFLAAAIASAADFSGASALEFTRKAVSFGPRPAGSEANKRLQAYIRAQLRTFGAEVMDDSFTAHTPNGPIAMTNILGRFKGSSGRAVAFSGHFDSKQMPGFVGANDGGSSTGLLLELARVLAGRPRKDGVYVIFFDAEEAFGPWSDVDGVYGSRHLADKWAADGTLKRLKALINVDMIGDKDLGIALELNSSAWLRMLVWDVAAGLGYRSHFLTAGSVIEDDHMPFIRRGAQALDLIDFDYGPHNEFWHTPQDTMDKLSPASLQVVGRVLVETLKRLEQRP